MHEGYKYTIYDFPEDFKHENGNYEGVCRGCGVKFIGYKRRLRCKRCVSNQELVETRNRLNVTSEPVRILLDDEIAVKTSKIDAVIKQVNYQGDIMGYNFNAKQLLIMLEELKKG